jgi:nucleotide-binding universal stress UspA family protein
MSAGGLERASYGSEIPMKVLMATDGSPSATAALEAASRFLRPEGCEIDLLCVAPPFPRSDPHQTGRFREAYERKILAETMEILEQARSTLRSNGFEARPVSDLGPPADIILRRASGYDLTVIGAKGRDVRFNVGLGPAASRLVERSSVPVLVGRELVSDRGFRVLAPVDGSMASLRALETAGGLFHFESAEITLMHVIETPWIHLGMEEEWLDEFETEEAGNQPGENFERELTRGAEAVFEKARASVGRTQGVQTVIERGTPGNEILSAAERGEHDLIILGATGVTDLKHRMLGSVSSKVAWNAPCSVLVVSAPE